MIIQSNFVPNGLELRNVITVSVFFGIAADRRIGQKRNQLSNCTTRNCIIIIIIIIKEMIGMHTLELYENTESTPPS